MAVDNEFDFTVFRNVQCHSIRNDCIKLVAHRGIHGQKRCTFLHIEIICDCFVSSLNTNEHLILSQFDRVVGLYELVKRTLREIVIRNQRKTLSRQKSHHMLLKNVINVS